MQKTKKKFSIPIRNARQVYHEKEKKKSPGIRIGTSQFKVMIPEDILKKFITKATQECPSPTPALTVIHLLLDYYLNNELILHRRLILEDEETQTVEPDTKIKKGRRSRVDYTKIYPPGTRFRGQWLRLTQYEIRQLDKKLRQDGLTKHVLINLLIQYYLQHKFRIKTKIIRLPVYRTGKPEKDIPIFANREDEYKKLKKALAAILAKEE